jgi:ubiquinone/menaquinone biosynthesis C-methylase UbiE
VIQDTITPEKARCFYDSLGSTYDIGERFERRAKARGFVLLDLAPGQRLLNVGVGTGKDQTQIQNALMPGGLAAGVDLSPVMVKLARANVPPPGNEALCVADGGGLPFPDASFDRVISSYVLDLIPARRIPLFVREMQRVLRPGGRLVLVGLTEGTTLASRAVMAAWKAIYRLSPASLGGCRPLRMTYPLLRAGFVDVRREVIVQGGMPSEVLSARRP